MPKIPIPTAQRGPGVLQLPTADPRSFGVQAGEAVTEFGAHLKKLGDRIQDQQDETDLIDKEATHKEFLATLPQAILEDDTIPANKRVSVYRERAAQHRDGLLQDASPTVQRAFTNRSTQLQSEGVIHMQAADIEARVQTARADLTQHMDRFADQQATALAQGDVAGYHTALTTAQDLLQRAEQRGTINPIERRKAQEAATDRMFTQLAEQHSMKVIEMTDAVKAGTPGDYFGMDKAKATYYGNLAINALHANQAILDAEHKKADAEAKKIQETNKAKLQASVIAGTPIDRGAIEQLIRDRQLDGDVVAPALALQKTLTEVPDMSRYQRTLATEMESQLRQNKYDNTAFDPTIFDRIQARLTQGHLLHSEATHLMAMAGDVQAHKTDPSKSARNTQINHAAANLETVMESANKLTGFSAIGNQATANAKEYFYRRLEQEPTANPWDVMHEAETRFKPLVEKQQGISKVDQMLLDDAKVSAKAALGIVSKAVVSQDDRGRKIVNDALKALPPPPEPGFLERLFQKKEATQTRKAPGVMGQ